jgi:hypothetical protein
MKRRASIMRFEENGASRTQMKMSARNAASTSMVAMEETNRDARARNSYSTIP